MGNAGADERTGVLIMLTLMVGLIQLALGLLKLGWITKFVSNSVMVGFITGVCILIILGQLGDLTGYSSEYSNKVVKTVDLVLHFDEVSWTTLAVGLATVGLILALGRTPARKFAMVLAFAVVTVGVAVLGLGVQLVSDVAAIPSGLPEFQVPDFSKAAGLIVPAIAIAAIGLIQGAGVSKSVPNPGGEYGDDSRDFAAQGVANAAVSFFQGMPIGGSVSASALNVSSGARSRWANVYAGVIVAVVLLLFGSAIEKVPMATVAALLIVAAVGSLKPAAILEVWRTNWAARVDHADHPGAHAHAADPVRGAGWASRSPPSSTSRARRSTSRSAGWSAKGKGGSARRTRPSVFPTARSPSSTSTGASSTRRPT